MIDKARIERLRQYNQISDTYPKLDGASEALSHFMSREVEVITVLGGSKEESLIRIKSHLRNRRSGEDEAFMIVLEYVKGQPMTVSFQGVESYAGFNITTDNLSSLQEEITNITASEVKIIEILEANEPFIERLTKENVIRREVYNHIGKAESILEQFGPITTEAEKEQLGKDLYKLPYDNWPHRCVVYGSTKSRNRDRVLKMVDRVDELIIDIEMFENEVIERYSKNN